MASWRELYKFGTAEEPPQWMRMDWGTSSPQAILYPEVGLHPDSGYNAGYHHSEYQPEQRTGHQSNHRIWWTPPAGYDPPECRMVLNVPICSDNGHQRVKDELIEIEGVRAIDVDRAKMEVTVSGTFAPKEVLNACRKIFKRSNWQPT